MTPEQTKAEAEKIINSYIDHVAIDYQYDEEPLRDCQIECAILQVKGIMKEIDMYKGELNPRWKHWKSILTELESQ